MNPHRLSLYGSEEDTIGFSERCLQEIVMKRYLRQPVLTLSVSEVQVLLLLRTKALFTYPLYSYILSGGTWQEDSRARVAGCVVLALV